MKYLFEDREDDVLSVLYRNAYPVSVTRDFVYSNGSGNLYGIAESISKSYASENILVFLDVVPDNRETMKTYSKLSGLYSNSGGRVITMPIICTEHYFIKSIQGSSVIKDTTGLDACCEVLPWRESGMLVTDNDRKKAKNFERFCKLFLIKALKDCAKHSRDVNKSNAEYGYYYTLDCLCEGNKDWCVSDLLIDKAIRFVHQFPCYPLGDLGSPSRTLLDRDKLLDLNEILCTWHNAKIQEFGTQNICETLTSLKDAGFN
jgi:hypothetical protein